MRLLSSTTKAPALQGSPSGSTADLRASSALDSSNPFANPFFEEEPFHPAAQLGASNGATNAAVGIPSASPASRLHEVPLFDTPSSGAGLGPGSTADRQAFLPPPLPLGNPFLSATPPLGATFLGTSPPLSTACYEEHSVGALEVEDSSEQVHGGGWGKPRSWGRSKSAGASGGAAGLAGGTAMGREDSSRRSLSSVGGAEAWEGSEAMPAAASTPAKWSSRLPWVRKEAAPPPLSLSEAPSFGAMLPPPSNGWAGAGGHASDREAALDLRERELAKREAEVARREAAAAGAGGGKRKNWPRCRPMLHHDISGEVPSGRQALVRTAYLTWCITAAAYLFNWLAITIMFATGEKSVSLWLFASLVAGFGLPLSFFCWYRSLYFAAIKDSAGRWAWYFLHMAVNFAWSWWMFVGVEPKLGGYSAGLFTMIEQFSNGGGKGSTFGILSVINMVLWGLGGLLSFSLLGWGMRVFRGRDRQQGVASPAGAPSRRG